MEVLVIVISFVLCQQVSALRDLTAEEFARFPDLYHIDRFSHCLDASGGVYCVASAELIPHMNQELYDSIKNFSFSAMRHLDYRKIRYGYCITKRCKEFHTSDSEETLEATTGTCLNNILQQEYGLRARIDHTACYHHGDKRSITLLDYVAAVLCLSLVCFVVAGTLYDMLATNKDTKGYLLCFSIPANWAKLTAPWPKEPTTARLIGVNGIRAINSIIVMVVHSMMLLPSSVENPYAIEESMETTTFNLLVNAHIMVQTFLFLSGMLLAYTTQVANEKNPLTLRSLPKAILLRWLRLSPMYLAILLYVATWFKFTPQGPMWQELVANEAHDCQKHWLSMLFFYNNYVFGSQCQPHHWSTSVDVQLHVVGLAVLLLPGGARAITLVLLSVMGLIASGLETYYRNLDGIISSGKNVQTSRMFAKYDTFNYLYKPTHTNLTVFFMGLAFGLLLYNWMKSSIDTSKYQKYALLYWLVLPLCVALIYSYSYLELEAGGLPSMRLRLMFVMLQKPLWGAAIAGLIFGMICKVENVYRRVLEWRGWVPLTRLSYCTYNVHMVIIRWLYAADSQLTHVSDLHLIIKTTGIVVFCFALAVPMFLLVESPSNNVVRRLFPEKQSILDVSSATKKTE